MTTEMWNGLIFYGILALITAVFADFSIKRSSKHLGPYFAFLTVLLPSIFAGLRYGIGTDYYSYQDSFYRITNSISTMRDNTSVYWVISKVVGIFGGDFQVVLFITSFITTLFIYLALREYKNDVSVGLGMFIYMLVFYQMSFNIVRQITALAIILFAIKYINKKDLIRFSAFILLASTFHITAILFYPLYFLRWLYGTKKYKFLKILSYTTLLVLVVNLSEILIPITSIIDSYYVRSYISTTKEFELGIGIFLRTLPLIIPGIIFWKSVKQDKNMLLLFNILIIGCILLLSAYSSTNFTERIAYYFLAAQIIFIPFIYRKCVESRKKYIGIIIVLAIISLWFVDFIYLGRNETIPYNWIIK